MAGFWNEQTTDPKRKFRWYLIFGTDEGGEQLSLAAKKIDKPKFEISTTPHKFINHTFFFPGRLEWKPITATFVDIGPSGGDVSSTFTKMIKDAGYEPPFTTPACRKSLTKNDSVDAFGSDFTIVQVKGDGTPAEKWKLNNPWISSVEYGDLDYGAEDLVELTLTIVYDSAQPVAV